MLGGFFGTMIMREWWDGLFKAHLQRYATIDEFMQGSTKLFKNLLCIK
jgi:hypothetical protein